MYLLSLVLLLPLGYLLFRYYYFLIPNKKGLPVLMYHKISLTEKDFLTITTEQFELQLNYLKLQNYQTITVRELIDSVENGKTLDKKSVLITFDDGYLNNLELAYPLLKKYNFKASIFLPTAFIGQRSSWDQESDALMTVGQLKSLDSNTIELALHTHSHKNFKHLALQDMETEIMENMQFFYDHKLEFTPALAYAYGGRPKDKIVLKEMKKSLQDLGVKMAFRIGNRINKLPVTDVYEVNRIDIRGTDSIRGFTTKLKKGRVKLL